MSDSPLALIGISVTDFGADLIVDADFSNYADSVLIATIGTLLSPHMHGATEVTGAVMITGSVDTFADRKPVCRIGDTASCSCVVITGDTDTFCL